MDTEHTPFDQKLFLVFIVTFAAMTFFEFVGQFLYPYPPDWRSNLVTSFFTSGLAVIIAYFSLKSYYDTNVLLVAEMEKEHFMEKELEESEKKFRMIFENSLDGSLIASLDGGILFRNRALVEIFDAEYQPDSPTSKRVMDFVAPESRSQAFHDFSQMAQGIDGYLMEYKAITATGRPIWIEGIGKKIQFQNNPAVLISVRDISTRKRMEEAILRANKQLTLLTSITRHDINNQLQALNGFIGILRKEAPDPSLENYFSRITEAGSRITAMIRFTKEYEEIGERAAVWQNLDAILNGAAEGVTLGTVKLKNELSSGGEVFADPLIVKVFFNLIDNALRHGGGITTIRFFLEPRNLGWVLVCEDDGEGIADKDKEKIFERGFGKNTGFGLYISREILTITGISIRENGEPGKGARFEIAIPSGAYRNAGTEPPNDGDKNNSV